MATKQKINKEKTRPEVLKEMERAINKNDLEALLKIRTSNDFDVLGRKDIATLGNAIEKISEGTLTIAFAQGKLNSLDLKGFLDLNNKILSPGTIEVVKTFIARQ